MSLIKGLVSWDDMTWNNVKESTNKKLWWNKERKIKGKKKGEGVRKGREEEGDGIRRAGKTVESNC